MSWSLGLINGSQWQVISFRSFNTCYIPSLTINPNQLIDLTYYLSVTQHTDNSAVSDQLLEVTLYGLLSIIILPFLGILSESLFLGMVPKEESGYLISQSVAQQLCERAEATLLQGWSSPWLQPHNHDCNSMGGTLKPSSQSNTRLKL